MLIQRRDGRIWKRQLGEMEGKGIQNDFPDPTMLYFVRHYIYTF